MDDATETQLRLIREIASAFAARGIVWWLYGGWAMDFHAGEVTRDHADIEIFVRLDDASRVREALVDAGFAAPSPLHPDECQPFLKDGQEAGVWYLTRDAANRIVTPGRWADWPWLAGAFDAAPASIGDLTAPAMSIAALLDMKENFARHPHGRPLREKDIADIARLREMLDEHRA